MRFFLLQMMFVTVLLHSNLNFIEGCGISLLLKNRRKLQTIFSAVDCTNVLCTIEVPSSPNRPIFEY